MPPLLIQVPIELPSAERMEAIYREEVQRVIAARDCWMTLDEAADYLRWSRSTFDRQRKKFGLPVSNPDGKPIVSRADVDEMAKKDMAPSGGVFGVLQFPSQQQAQAQSAA